jgi:DNA-binding transcriptional LysR family regulator
MSILRLEAELSCKLFKRTGKERLALTEKGEFLYIYAEKIIAQFAICEEYFECKNKTKSLHISSACGIMTEFAGKLVSGFQAEYSDILVFIKESPDKACENAVESDETELGFSVGHIDSKRFDARLLFSRRYCIVVHRSHPLAAEKTASFDMLRTAPVIMLNEDYKMHNTLLNLCHEHGFQPNIRFLAGETAAILSLVSLNYGVGVSVENLRDKIADPDICVIPFEDREMRWSGYLIKKLDAPLSKAAKVFERYIIRRIESESDAFPF